VQRAVRVYKKPDSNDSSTDGPIAVKEGGFWPPLRRSLSEIAGAWQDEGWNLVWLVLLVGQALAVIALIRVGTDDDDVVVDEKRIATFYPPASTEWKSTNTNFFITVSVGSIAVVFGAIHCIALPFLSDAERILWRVCSA
jgi:hypothetical protein